MPLPRLSALPPRPGQLTGPGSFNTRVTFYTQANPTASIPASAFVETWAALRPVSAEEMDKAQQIAQKVSHLCTIRYQPGILASMTIQLGEAGNTRVFRIVGIEDPEERHDELRILCYEINQNAGSAS